MNYEKANPDAFPIQIVNGVISLDFGRGCLGCKWCITKRQDGRVELQDMQYKNILSGEVLFGLLSKCLAFTEAKLPLRIGNNTDGTLIPVQELSDFLGFVGDHPTMLLTRGMHSSGLQNTIVGRGTNFMLAHTVTFPHESLQYFLNAEKLLKCFLQARCNKVLNLGPICEENYEQVKGFVLSNVLPLGTRLIFAPLNLRKLPDSITTSVSAVPINIQQRMELENIALQQGYVVHRSNNCAHSEMASLQSLEFGDMNNGVLLSPSLTSGTTNYNDQSILCELCRNLEVCKTDLNTFDIDYLNQLLEKLLLPDAKILAIGNKLLQIGLPGITKAETSYLSGMLGIRVTSPNSENIPSVRSLNRWQESGFYPVEEVLRIAPEFDPVILSAKRI